MSRSMIMLTALLLALVAACGESADDDVVLDDPTEDATPEPDETPEETPEPEPTEDADDEEPEMSPSPEAEDGHTPRPGSDMEITGVLGGDPSLEGGCVWVDADDGNRYEVMWPDGYEADRETGELQDADGELVASGGDEVTVAGQVAEDMMSICQVGIIFQAESVTVE